MSETARTGWREAAARFGRACGPGLERARRLWRPVAPALRWGLVLALAGYVGWRLHGLGPARVWAALPSGPGFYAVAIGLFFIQPFADRLIFRRLWPRDGWPGLKVMLRKRFLNSTVLDYSGEAYLLAWARAAMPGQDRLILHTLKDSNILSASASLLVLVLLVGGLVAAVPTRFDLPPRETAAFLALVTLSVLPTAAYLVSHRRMTTVAAADLRFVFAVHFGRAAAVNATVLLLWRVGLGAVPVLALLQLLALRLVAARLPFAGHKDLLFLGGALGLSQAFAVPQAELAAVVLAAMAFEMVLNLLVVGLPMLGERPRRG